MSQKKFDIAQVTLEDITIKIGTLENSGSKVVTSLSELEVSFGYKLYPALNLRANKVQITAIYEVNATPAGSKKNKISSLYSIVFLFVVKNLSELAIPEKHLGLSVDPEMLSNLFNITYSTSRGILYTRYLGTILQGVILPVISTAELAKIPSGIKSISAKK